MKKLVILLFLTIILPAAAQKPLSPRKAYRPIRTALKAKKPQDALTTINKLVVDSLYRDDPKLYSYGIEAEILLCEALNEKMYLDQKIDTAQFFQANYDLLQFILRCDSSEQRLVAQNPTTYVVAYRKGNQQLLQQYYPNMSAAGRFHYAKRSFAQARKYFALYFLLPHHDIWGSDTSVIASKTYTDNIYLDFRAMYELQQYDEMPRYADILLADSTLHTQVLDMLITAAKQRGDSIAYIGLVEQGLHEQPHRLDYFAVLSNFYTEHNDYGKSLALADSLLAKDPLNKYYLESRTFALFKLQQMDECLIAAQRLYDVDSTSTIACYTIGYYYVQKADNLEMPQQTRSNLYRITKERQAQLYQEAQPYLERYRELMPEEQELWAPLLYKVYLNLNLGTKFEEIESIINASQIQI